jgi:hypothetical protein
VAVVLAVQLLAGLGGLVALRLHDHEPPAPAGVRGRVVPAAELDAVREAAVRELLEVRGAAIRDRDREAWLATVEPTQEEFLAKQADLFDALAEVPLGDWSYRLDPESAPPPNVDLDPVRGSGWWAPGVTLTYRIEGYDDVATREQQRLTFVPRGSSWFVAADDDFAAAGRDTTRGLWDSGRVVVTRGRSCIVLGHPGSRSLMRRVATSIDAAVPRVVAAWGEAWSQRVVALVPSSQDELGRVVGGHGDYSQIAAVATAELTNASAGYHPVGDRIVINPPNFAKLGTLGRRVVLTHEVTHVATRAASGPAAPVWLVEGFADYVGYRGVHVPYSVSAAELRSSVRRGRVPDALPSDRDFEGNNTHLAQVYEEAWLAVSLLAEQHGRDELLQFYRAVGRPGAQPAAVDDAFRDLWGTSLAAFTAEWQRDLVTRLR